MEASVTDKNLLTSAPATESDYKLKSLADHYLVLLTFKIKNQTGGVDWYFYAPRGRAQNFCIKISIMEHKDNVHFLGLLENFNPGTPAPGVNGKKQFSFILNLMATSLRLLSSPHWGVPVWHHKNVYYYSSSSNIIIDTWSCRQVLTKSLHWSMGSIMNFLN